MFFIAIACIINIGLDYLFIGVFHLGPTGAALGATLAQTVGVMVSFSVMMRRKKISLQKKDFKPCHSVMRKILSIGIPISLQDGLIQIAFIVITIIANRRGFNDAAAVGIVEKVISFLFLVPSSILSAVSAMGAQNIGAGKPGRAIQTLRYAVFIATGFGLIVSVTTVRIPGAYITSQLFPSTLFPMGLATAAGSVLSVLICVIAFKIIQGKNKRLHNESGNQVAAERQSRDNTYIR